MTSGNKTGPWLDTWKREDKSMKELARFDVDIYEYREKLCISLAMAGYPVKVITEHDEFYHTNKYCVVVYEKEDK